MGPLARQKEFGQTLVRALGFNCLALETQLKAADDNIEGLRHELHDLKNGVGFKRAVG